VTLLGKIKLNHDYWEIPEEYQSPSIGIDDTGIILVALNNKNIPVDRCGLNVGIEEDDYNELIDELLKQFGMNYEGVEVFPIVNGDGLHSSCYSAKDAEIVSRFIKSNPNLAGSYQKFIS
jgi:hypothetical protein